MQEQQKTPDPEAVRIIEAMGGPTKIATEFEITRQAVSQWQYGIPKMAMIAIKAKRPDLFPEEQKAA